MLFRSLLHQPPNPPIERTCSGVPIQAAHAARWASLNNMASHRTIAEVEFSRLPSLIGGGVLQHDGSHACPRGVACLSRRRLSSSQSVGAVALPASVALGSLRAARQRRVPASACGATSVHLHRFNELVSVGGKAPPSKNVGQSVGAAGQRSALAFMGSGEGGSGVAALPRPPARSALVTPNPSIKRTVKGLCPSPAAYVKR